tara:strand:- start:277 stop:696 length:420 start_codon:yes stop_codon:yes gene_type:complete
MHLSILDGLPADRRVLDGAAQQLARSDALDDHAPEMLTRISPMSVNGTLQVPVGLAVFLDATPYIPDELALGVHTHLFARTPSRILGVRHPKPNLGGGGTPSRILGVAAQPGHRPVGEESKSAWAGEASHNDVGSGDCG